MAIEFRVPDATANPYLALAAVLLAGLDGVRKKIDPGLPISGRAGGKGIRSRGKPVPSSLAEALKELEQDNRYLVEDGVFREETIEKWIDLKMREVEAIGRRPHPWEFNLYYGC